MKHLFFLIYIILPSFVWGQANNYGADEANKRFMSSLGMLGGPVDFDYLNLKNHPAASGVPLGGIGAGNVQFAPDGRFVRIGLNNIHLPIRRSEASFFSVWYNDGQQKQAYRLVNDGTTQYGLSGVDEIYYTGLFPRAEVTYGKQLPVDVKIHAYSSLIPHDVKNSSLPLVFFDVEVQSAKGGEVAIAFSWEDFIGREIKEPTSLEGLGGQLFSHGRERKSNGEIWPDREPEYTFAEEWQDGNLAGIRQFATQPLQPARAGFQNYVNEIVLLAEQKDDRQVSYLAGFDRAAGEKAWGSFRENGFLNEQRGKVVPLSVPDQEIKGGSAIALKTTLKPGEKKVMRFMLVWYFPELIIDRETDTPDYFWTGGSDYGRYFHNYFRSLTSVVRYGYQNRDFLLTKTKEWQKPVLESTLPDWYKFKLINCGYVIYTNMILNKKGDMTVNEGGMGGLAGTMDQRIASHPFYQKFFTQLDRSEMDIFAEAQNSNGYIPHFIGHYYMGMGTVGGRVPTEDSWMIDNTGGWIIQLAKDYQQTGDINYLKRHSTRVHDGMSFLKSLMPENLEIPIGPTTYDDFDHPPVYSYGAGIYLATLRAAAEISKALGDEKREQEYNAQFVLTQQDMIRMLWNGRFFSYGCEIDGSGRLDNILFTGQLGGQFVSRYCGWGDIIPMDMVKASLVSQFKLSLSNTPDYYANKVWDIEQGKGIDNRGSQCWPFYLESYTGYAAWQAGYQEDAWEIMKHIQLVHLRKGWTWCQNLWNPAELSYMTAPVTWFATDVLAGAGLNVPEQELRLAPVIEGKSKLKLPLFYPTFWGMLTVDPSSKKLLLEITKTYDNNNVVISKIVSEPVGGATENKQQISIPAFAVKEGAVLDLSSHWNKIVQTKSEKSVLKNPDKVDFIMVDR